jgi:pyridoxal phosphate enzyme (YggS family)
MTTAVAEGLRSVRERVAAACARAGRRPDEVTLIAVSKLQPLAAVEAAHAAGQRDFGENYAQELRDKSVALARLEEVRWHAIGPLQKNKVKYVARAAHAFHALDDLEVAQALSQRRQGSPLVCFLEVNIGAEGTKSGVSPAQSARLLTQVRALPNLDVRGLMCLPPPGETPEASRPHFQALRAVAHSLGLSWLSMGTTGDFEVAIEEGATHVRVGTAIFGSRP